MELLVPVSTRWNSWFEAVVYHATRVHTYEGFFKAEKSKVFVVYIDLIGERAKRARHSQVCSIENRGYIYIYHRRMRHLQSGKARKWVWSSCNVCNQLLMGAN